jgi:hypothetical protein
VELYNTLRGSDAICFECSNTAEWVRSTQFAGEHPYCEEHARLESDFNDEPNSYTFWYKIKDEKTT